MPSMCVHLLLVGISAFTDISSISRAEELHSYKSKHQFDKLIVQKIIDLLKRLKERCPHFTDRHPTCPFPFAVLSVGVVDSLLHFPFVENSWRIWDNMYRRGLPSRLLPLLLAVEEP